MQDRQRRRAEAQKATGRRRDAVRKRAARAAAAGCDRAGAGQDGPTFDGATLRPLVQAARGTAWEAAAALLEPYDGAPVSLGELERRAARRFATWPGVARAELARRALVLVESGPW